jgi:hypothetical protein
VRAIILTMTESYTDGTLSPKKLRVVPRGERD